MSKETNIGKRIVLEFLDFLRFKVENDRLTMEDTEAIARTLESSLDLTGTADDFARFYGKTKTNVTTVIDRKMLSKPERRVSYRFREFQRARPEGWNKHDDGR